MPLSLLSWIDLYVYPLLVVLALWGGLTGGLVWLNRHGPRAGKIAALAMIGLLVVAHQQLWLVRDDLSSWGCYRAFTAGLLIWAWHELAFYSGLLTGPWQAACPPEARGWTRFRYALSTHLYHEIAVIIEIGALCWLLRDSTNWIGLLTFALSWALQHSAKLNVLLGVRNLNVELFPAHLHYLSSFWNRRPITPFFFVSVAVASLGAVAFWVGAVVIAPQPHAVGMTLLASLAALGALEHWLLVLPTPQHASSVSRRLAE